MLDEQLLPTDIDAERLMLGTFLSRPESLANGIGLLEPECFSVERHKRIYAAMRQLFESGKQIDRLTVAHVLIDRGQIGHDGLSYLSDLDSGLGPIFDGDHLLSRLKELSLRRRMIRMCHKLAEEWSDQGLEASDLVGRAQTAWNDLDAPEARKRAFMRFGEIVREEGFDSLLRPPDVLTKSPWPQLNRLVSGFRNGQLIIMAARPGIGKSAMLMQCAIGAARAGVGVAVFSLEMSRLELASRMLSVGSGVNMRAEYHDSEQRDRIIATASWLDSLPLWIDDTTGCTVPAIEAALRRMTAKNPIGMVVVDYLQLMETVSRRENRTQEITQISRGLKLAAKKFNVPFLVAAQLNRASEAEKRRPQLHDLRESGSVEQDADVVIFIHPTEKLPQNVAQPVEVIVAKQRNGPRGKVTLTFAGELVRFEERIED